MITREKLRLSWKKFQRRIKNAFRSVKRAIARAVYNLDVKNRILSLKEALTYWLPRTLYNRRIRKFWPGIYEMMYYQLSYMLKRRQRVIQRLTDKGIEVPLGFRRQINVLTSGMFLAYKLATNYYMNEIVPFYLTNPRRREGSLAQDEGLKITAEAVEYLKKYREVLDFLRERGEVEIYYKKAPSYNPNLFYAIAQENERRAKKALFQVIYDNDNDTSMFVIRTVYGDVEGKKRNKRLNKLISLHI